MCHSPLFSKPLFNFYSHLNEFPSQLTLTRNYPGESKACTQLLAQTLLIYSSL